MDMQMEMELENSEGSKKRKMDPLLNERHAKQAKIEQVLVIQQFIEPVVIPQVVEPVVNPQFIEPIVIPQVMAIPQVPPPNHNFRYKLSHSKIRCNAHTGRM